MIRIYLDIDGVLLTAKHTQAAPDVDGFVDFITTHFECYWLTTHCKGESATAIKYLSRFLNPLTLEKLSTAVQPTNWNTLKTEALDLQANFFWLDDNPFQSEINFLRANGLDDNLILVDIHRPNELIEIQSYLAQV